MLLCVSLISALLKQQKSSVKIAAQRNAMFKFSQGKYSCTIKKF